jgi:hypothetical protein
MLATAQAPIQAGAWADTAQYASSLEVLRRPAICPDEVFRQRVQLRQVDMTRLPADLAQGQFALLWSSCACEHVGSLPHSLDFLCLAMACLQPGGVAVHTTEWQIDAPDWPGLVVGGTVLFRPNDLVGLDLALGRQGDRLWPLDLTPGLLPADFDVDPMVEDRPRVPHLALRVYGLHRGQRHPFTTTSIALIMTRGQGGPHADEGLAGPY